MKEEFKIKVESKGMRDAVVYKDSVRSAVVALKGRSHRRLEEIGFQPNTYPDGAEVGAVMYRRLPHGKWDAVLTYKCRIEGGQIQGITEVLCAGETYAYKQAKARIAAAKAELEAITGLYDRMHEHLGKAGKNNRIIMKI